MYIALARRSNDYYQGTLAHILDQIEDDDCDVEDYIFYEEGKVVQVELEKKLTLVVKE